MIYGTGCYVRVRTENGWENLDIVDPDCPVDAAEKIIGTWDNVGSLQGLVLRMAIVLLVSFGGCVTARSRRPAVTIPSD